MSAQKEADVSLPYLDSKIAKAESFWGGTRETEKKIKPK